MLHQLKLRNILDVPYSHLIRANVTIYKIMQVTAEREEFLRNTANKVQFIDFLINTFKREKVNVIQNDGDPDVNLIIPMSSFY